MIEADETLIARMSRGDEAALAELHRRYAPTVLALAKRMLPDEIEQAVETIFLEAWQKAGSFKGGVSVKTWLVTLAHRQLLGRRYGTQAGLPAFADWDLPEPPQPLRRLYVEDAFLELSDEERALLEAAYFEGRSFESLAAQLGTGAEAVAARLVTTLERLREGLREDDGGR